jgi:hypothetical protein
MVIPLYWGEARQQRIVNGRQWTIRRWGWSDESLSDVQLKAEARVEKAFGQVAEGVELPRRERKVAHNGAEGAPIRCGLPIA